MATETVTFNWSTAHGRCYDCGFPAMFLRGDPTHDDRLCAVCAANAAVDGEDISRIDPDDVS